MFIVFWTNKRNLLLINLFDIPIIFEFLLLYIFSRFRGAVSVRLD